MPSLETLTPSALEIKNLQMRAQGYCLWLVWDGEFNPLVEQTLEEYGGVRVEETDSQALWFFFSTEVCLAAARLGVWSRFNPVALFVEILPAVLEMGGNEQKRITIAEPLRKQNVTTVDRFQVWAHPEVLAAAEGMPGITLDADAERPEGMAQENWALVNADSRLPYESSMGWYVILRPVGKPADKKFQTGWREFFPHIETLLQRNKFRFTITDYFLMFPLEGGMKKLRAWCHDFLGMVNRVRLEAPEQYWPCVMAVVDKKHLTFNDELPDKIGIDWRQLAPDFPHMAARNAFMLGDEFCVQGVRFAPLRHTPDDWCSVSLCEDREIAEGSMPHLVPEVSLGSFAHCFYCGQRSHEPKDCPTRTMPARDVEIWKQMAFLDFDAMSEAVKAINAAFVENGTAGMRDIIKKQAPEGLFLRALFDIDWPVQMRSVDLFWRAKDKDLKQFVGKRSAEESSVAWTALEEFAATDPEEREKNLIYLSTRYPKDFRLMTLRGFDAMERGDWQRAAAFWKEAEMTSPYPVVASWHLFLQARCLEAQNMLSQASVMYDQIRRQCPGWTFVPYRKIVCEVKSGFSSSVLPSLVLLIEKDGNYFNQALIDPEMERGYIQILATLNRMWVTLQEQVKKEAANLKRLLAELPNWFIPDHEFAAKTAERIKTLLQMGTVHNYVTFQALVQGRIRVERDLQKFVGDEGRQLRDSFKNNAERLQYIKDEAAWFPFPRSLKEFNRKYNESVAGLNWVLRANLHLPEAFKKAQTLKEQQEERLKYLEKKMRFLRIIRDATLFLLSIAETFFWIEIIGIIVIFALLPLLVVYGENVGLEWTANLVVTKQFYVQKALFFLLSMFAIGIAGLRTVLRFEKIREKVFAKARAAATVKRKG